jgi:type I restriction enzyme M protein
LKADIILANPPYNQKGWDEDLVLSTDPRFKDLPKPPSNNGNFAWILHCLHHLNDEGIACIVMANGSLTTSQKDELAVREYLVKNDLVEAIITLPPKLFMSTGIPCCIWIINKQKMRRGKMLLIDLSNQGKPISRKQNELGEDTIAKVLDQISRWRIGEELEKVNFLINIDHASVEDRKFTLAPGQYLEVEVERVEITEESFMEKISKLIYDFERLADEEQRLTKQIISNMKKLTYEHADNDEI